jgi:hypothetical protein
MQAQIRQAIDKMAIRVQEAGTGIDAMQWAQALLSCTHALCHLAANNQLDRATVMSPTPAQQYDR